MKKNLQAQNYNIKFITVKELQPRTCIKKTKKLHLDLKNLTVKSVDTKDDEVAMKSLVDHEHSQPVSQVHKHKRKKKINSPLSIPFVKIEQLEENSGRSIPCEFENVLPGVSTPIDTVQEIVICNSEANDPNKFTARVEESRITPEIKEEICSNGISLLADVIPEINQKSYRCKSCPFVTFKEWELRKHRYVHSGRKYLSCPFCSHISPSKPRLVAHIRVHTGERPFSCEYCPYKTKQKHDLKRHQRIHTGEKPYKCGECSFAASDKRALVVHQRIHTGEQPFQCHVCNLCLTQKQQLIRHLRTHSGEKPFKCELCLYRASRKHHLTSHMRTHTGEKPYKCNLCSYSAVQKFSLELHLKNHSEMKGYICGFCSYSSKRKKVVISHQRIHLNEIKPEKQV